MAGIGFEFSHKKLGPVSDLLIEITGLRSSYEKQTEKSPENLPKLFDKPAAHAYKYCQRGSLTRVKRRQNPRYGKLGDSLAVMISNRIDGAPISNIRVQAPGSKTPGASLFQAPLNCVVIGNSIDPGPAFLNCGTAGKPASLSGRIPRAPAAAAERCVVAHIVSTTGFC